MKAWAPAALGLFLLAEGSAPGAPWVGPRRILLAPNKRQAGGFLGTNHGGGRRLADLAGNRTTYIRFERPPRLRSGAKESSRSATEGSGHTLGSKKSGEFRGIHLALD